MKSNRFNFTERALAALPVPTTGSAVYYDAGSMDGLCVIVTYGGTKTYYAYMKFQGVPRRVKIARVGQMKLIEARMKAHTLKERSLRGEDPSAERRDALKDMTLRQYYENIYVPQHSMVHKKPATVYDDNGLFRRNMKPFHNRQMRTISQLEVSQLHGSLKRKCGLYSANRTLGLLRHMYNKAYELGYPRRLENPAQYVKAFKEKSRDRFMSRAELARFFEALQYAEPRFRHYVLLSLFLGQRRSNILALRWGDIDFENDIVRFVDTKNGDTVNTPMTDQAREILIQMYRTAGDNPWLFPSSTSKSGHIEEPKRAWNALLKRANIENLRIHDLRRTMGSYQAITGSSLHIIGQSLGHRSTAATQIYARLSCDPVRESMQRATNSMLGLLG